MADYKYVFDHLTSFIIILIPVLLTYQAQIMNALPQDNYFLIYAISIFFGVLSAYAAKIRKDSEVAVALATPVPETAKADDSA